MRISATLGRMPRARVALPAARISPKQHSRALALSLSARSHPTHTKIQALLTRLLAGVVGDIIGEEDDAGIDISAPPFKAGAITAPTELEDLIVRLRERVDEMAAALRRTLCRPTFRQCRERSR